ncbi:putative MO25-like protein [Citrus sinensis]|uniref:MO25-like protein n=1 Tax=Citrus sinensis TaxID=2711 RepID=A0ACB8N6W6_CITSI|nr:putative MO25-like protein [Citrus sinensis]
MKGLFKPKPKTPVELVKLTRELLLYANRTAETREKKREEKMSELSKLLLEMRTVLFGSDQSEPNADACEQLTREFFKEDTLRLLIASLPKLAMGPRRDATHVVANLQRQRVDTKLIACTYLEANFDIMDTLILGYEDGDVALTYGAIARECIRHQSVARYVLESEHMKKFFSFLQIPNFDIASDAQATFKFFQEYNSQLLESSSYITKRHAVKDSNKNIQFESFHVFKLFVANQNKPPEIISVLIANRSKLLRFFSDFNIDRANEQFEADKLLVIREIATLDLNETPSTYGDDDDGETSPS